MKVQPIPHPWISKVVEILRGCDSRVIEWTLRAEQDWGQFGMEHEAYDLIINTLKVPGILGHSVTGMVDARDQSYTDCWAFLCPHPWGSSVPLYCKIGIHHSRIYINIFSCHVDDGSGKLETAIKAYRKTK